MMSFYVTLPSNVKSLKFENLTSNFTTELNIPIRLNGPYEVALVELTYDRSWDIDLGSVYYHFPDKTKTSISAFYKSEHFFRIDKIIDQLNRDLIINIFKKEQKEQISDSSAPLIQFKDNLIIFTAQKDHFFSIEGLLAHALHIPFDSKFSSLTRPFFSMILTL